MNFMKHELNRDATEIYKQIALGVPKTRVALRFNVTRDQLNYWLKKNPPVQQEQAA